MGIFSDLLGTSKSYFKLGLSGVRLKNSAGNLSVRNSGDSADAEVTASKVSISGEILDLNSDAAGAGADWKYSLQRPTTGMTAAVTLTLPVDDGTASQVLATDGSGNLSWASAGSTASLDHVDTTSLAFGTGSPLAMFSTGAGDVIEYIDIDVDTAFNGTAPTLSIGITGTTSKYASTTDVDLKTAGKYRVHPGLAAQGAESLIATYVADTSTAGAARILVHYSTPA
jgi:hypothetical protein